MLMKYDEIYTALEKCITNQKYVGTAKEGLHCASCPIKKNKHNCYEWLLLNCKVIIKDVIDYGIDYGIDK